ncbi:MAG: DUF3015 family protein [Bacteriovoracaceae bacterium]|nr:DUF3015 family protein [Bacteriovoracaceae bacterium]
MKKMLIAALLVTSASSFAAQYGTAGCGLGSIVIGDKPGFMQVSAATTNGTSGSQTFGITSGTSNCASGASGNTAAFIQANKASLANDIARGTGETLNSLTAMYGCDDKQIGKVLQQNYNTIFPSSTTPASKIDSSISGYMNSCKIKG